MVVRELDELLDIVVPLLGELDDLVNVLVARLLVLLRGETLTDLLGLLQLLVLLHSQRSLTSLETNKLEETTLFQLTPLRVAGVWWGNSASSIVGWWAISHWWVWVVVWVRVVWGVTRDVLMMLVGVIVTVGATGVQLNVLATAQRGASA